MSKTSYIQIGSKSIAHKKLTKDVKRHKSYSELWSLRGKTRISILKASQSSNQTDRRDDNLASKNVDLLNNTDSLRKSEYILNLGEN